MVQTLWDSITEFLSSEAGQRRRSALDEFGRDVGYYVPPEMRGLLGFAAEMTPSATIDRAAQAGGEMMAPGRAPMERVGSAGRMLSETAGVAAPMMVAPRAGMTAAQAVQEGLLGASVAAEDVGRRFVDRMTQPGPVPTMYSNPLGLKFKTEGIRAYHGSPHDFDRFSMDAIGTGEGAQAYGHGLYFAENEAVARGYRDALSGNRLDSAVFNLSDGVKLDPSTSAILRSHDGDFDAAIAELRDRATSSPLTKIRQMSSETADFLEANRSSISYNPKGSMYEVKINANPDDFLDWDAPFRELPQKQQSIIEGILKETEKPATPAQKQEIDDFLSKLDVPDNYAQDYDPMREVRGGGALASIERNLRNSKNNAKQLASQKLLEAGIPGIKYRDAGSRGMDGADGTRNFVVFDENLIEIVRKYGIAGAAAMLGMSQADVAQAMGQNVSGGLLATQDDQQQREDDIHQYLGGLL